VVRIRRTVIIIRVTANTGIRCIIVVTIMAGGAVIGDDGVLPIELVVIIVDIESRGLPSWLGGVAAFAICW